MGGSAIFSTVLSRDYPNAQLIWASINTISEISAVLGYESESAFSAVFKCIKGCSPQQYGRGRKRGNSVVDKTEIFHVTKRLEMAKKILPQRGNALGLWNIPPIAAQYAAKFECL